MAIPLNSLYVFESQSDQHPVKYYYRVTIYDSELLVPADTPMELYGDGFLLNYTGDENDLLATVIPSYVRLNFVVRNETDQDFIDTLLEFQEDRFFLSIERAISPDAETFDPYWYGVIAQDLIRYDDSRGCFPYNMEINAIDGLTRLKERDGNILEGTAGFFDMNELIVKMLLESAPVQMYETTDVLFAHNIKWFSNRMWDSFNSVSPIDPLRFTKMSKVNLFLIPDSSTLGYTYVKWFDVLERICKAYGCRMIHAKGRMNLIQVEQYDTRLAASTKTFQHYSKNYVTPTSPNMLVSSFFGPIAYNVLESMRYATPFETPIVGGQYNQLPQYSKVKLEWQVTGPNNIITPAQQDWSIQQCSNAAIPFDVGAYLSVSKEFLGISGAWGLYYDLYIEITNVDTPYQKRYLAQNNSWSTNAASFRRITKTGNTNPPTSPVTVFWDQFIPPVPFDCTICIRLDITNVYGFFIPGPSPYPKDPIINIFLNPQPERLVYIYDIPNYTQSSLTYEVDNLLFSNYGDNAITPLHSIWTWANQWEPNILWSKSLPSTLPHDSYTDFFGKSNINLYNDISRKKLYSTLWSDWNPFLSIDYDDHVYIANECEFSLQSGEWKTTLLEIRDES